MTPEQMEVKIMELRWAVAMLEGSYWWHFREWLGRKAYCLADWISPEWPHLEDYEGDC